MQSGCRWVYTLMDWETGEVVAKGHQRGAGGAGIFSRCEQAEQRLE